MLRTFLLCAFVIATYALRAEPSISPATEAKPAAGAISPVDNKSDTMGIAPRPNDVEISQRIRRELMKQNLSTSAKNVKISTDRGSVTLSGKVATAQEKRAVAHIAQSFATHVHDQLTVSQ